MLALQLTAVAACCTCRGASSILTLLAPSGLRDNAPELLQSELSLPDPDAMLQAAFGRQSLNISSIFVYVALVTGLLGNTLSIPFALYVFICQRDVADNVQAS